MPQGHDQLYTVSPVSPQPANRAHKYGNLHVLYYAGAHKTLERSSLYNKFPRTADNKAPFLTAF